MISPPTIPLATFALDPAVVHLNHGSFGAVPRAVLAAQDAIRARLEAAPMRFFVTEWQAALDAARARVASFVGAAPAGLVFVPNATTAVATVLASLVLAPDDELLVTDHGYRACSNAARALCARTGARVVVARLPWPVVDPAAVTAAILAAATERTRAVIVDHVTSPTALVLDVAAIARALAPRGITVIVDGAHAPGQLDVDVRALHAAGVAAYAANCHKWMCAPKGAALLSVTDRDLAPLVPSHGESPEYGPANRLHARHDWPGTHDPSAYLAVPAALDVIAAFAGPWPTVRARNHAAALAARALFADHLDSALPCPDAMIGAMAAIPIRLPADTTALAFERQLLADGWEVPIIAWSATILVRLSMHIYNEPAQALALARHLASLGVDGA